MPNITVRGLDASSVQALSAQLTPQLTPVFDCPDDWIAFIHSGDPSFICGVEVTQEVFIHVGWFDRGQAVKDRVAQVLTQGVLTMKPTVETTTVLFVPTGKEDYFENGTHY